MTLAIQRELDRRARRRDNAARCRASFRAFIEYSWNVVEPAKAFIPNWHIDAIAEHLQAVRDRKIIYLLINVPPGSAKSLLTAVQFPAWLWIDEPQYRIICATHSKDLTERDAVRSRDLITSDLYQDTFLPDWKLKTDSNAKDQYYTDKTGFRKSVSVGGRVTGHRGNAIIIDDILTVEQAYSDAERATACRFVSQTLGNRRNDLARDWQVAIGQRLHEADPYGEMIDSGLYTHLCLPSEFDSKRRCVTSLGWSDPRTKDKELLFPGLFPQKVIDEEKRRLQEYGFSSQHQQDPSPLGGGIIKSKWFRFYKEPPAFDNVLQSWDCAFKDLTESDYVAGCVAGLVGPKVYLLDFQNEHLGYSATKSAIKANRARFPRISHSLIEDKANGTAVIEELTRDISGVIAVQPEGGKVSRAFAASADCEAGNIYLPEGATWVQGFLSQIDKFPNGRWDDMVDAFTQLVNFRRMHGSGTIFGGTFTNELIYTSASAPAGLGNQGSYQQRVVALGYSSANPMCFLEILDTGRTIYVAREYYFDSSRAMHLKADAAYAKDAGDFVRGIHPLTKEVVSRQAQGVVVLTDQRAPNLHSELMLKGLTCIESQPVISSDEVMDAIRTVNTLFKKKMIRVHDSCDHFISDLRSYSWDTRKAKDGIEEPSRTNEHSIVPLLNFCKTMVDAWRVAR